MFTPVAAEPRHARTGADGGDGQMQNGHTIDPLTKREAIVSFWNDTHESTPTVRKK
jgi:hypothetical protein